MRTRFDSELDTLYVSMIKMGSLSETTLSEVGDALKSDDESRLGNIVDISHSIDEKEREIKALCMKLLLRHQPVAKDLRTISSAMKMITDMERIGDNAADIAEIIPFLHSRDIAERISLPEMANAVIEMVHSAIDAFVRSDEAKAEATMKMDDIVDDFFTKAKIAITDLIREGSAEAPEAPDLLMIAKYLERMGDHAASLARWVAWSLNANGDWLNNPIKAE